MATLRIENYREDRGGWHMRAEGEMEIDQAGVQAVIQGYALQYPARAFLDGVLVAEAQPMMAPRRRSKSR